MDLESESKLISLISQIFYMYSDVYMLSPRLIPRLTQIISLVSSMDLDSQPKPLSELMLLTFETISVFNSMDLVDQPEPLKKLISHIFSRIQFLSLVDETLSLEPEPELMTLIRRIRFFVISMNSNPQPELEPEPESELEPELELEPEPEPELEPEPKPEPEPEMESELEPEQEPEPELETVLISLISQLISTHDSTDADCDVDFISLSIQIISLVKSMDLDLQPKPESELMSLIAQTISLVNSMDLDSQPKPLSELISLISQKFSLVDSTYWDWDWDVELVIISLVYGTVKLEPEPDLISRMRQIFFVGIFMDSKWKKLISICPQVHVRLEEGKFRVTEEEISWMSNNCLPSNWEISRLTGGKDASHFFCKGCNGKSHEKYDKAPVEIKQSLHREHSLRLVLLERYSSRTRECYCCNEDLKGAIYYCEACNFAINFSCAQKPPVLSVNHPKWHEHPLALFPRQASLTCNLCALADSSSPIYMCPNCDIVVHLRCINLPRVIRISRHLHRISFTPSFDVGEWCCGVCRKKIKKYGGYSCVKDDCSYAAHSRCATQSNVWDGIELEGEPEEIEEEELESFVRISDGIIQHFSHQHHHLRLDENTSRDYDECKLCQGCITPIYSGNFYSCMQCDFILHEECAKLSRKIHHPIHPHMLTLVGGNGDVINYFEDNCSACPWMCKTGFFYKCGEEKCPNFQLHVQCATVSEPLVHESHVHPLFLTSKPGERRRCSVCKGLNVFFNSTNETFNCIECDFVLCFRCATLPQKVRYKHDKHMLTLSYGEETSTMTYWCEVCEHKINHEERFYMCDEYCCVTLHIECMLGRDLYMKPGSSWRYTQDIEVYVLPNNHMSRPICYICKKRCPHKIVFQSSGLILCSTLCYHEMKYNERRYDFDHK